MQHPHIATVVNKSDPTGVVYLKYVKNGSREIEILNHLQIDSPANHTIRPISVWPIHDGSIISMPVAGGWLTSLSDPSSHLLGVANQLFEAVGFMHDHNVAHLDLKPQNIIIPIEYGRLTIIDFSVSVRFKRPEQLFSGLVGTEGYTAPEVGKEPFNAVRADLWACGKVMQDFCERCEPSGVRSCILAINDQLMNGEPKKRPTMRQVLEWLSRPLVYPLEPSGYPWVVR